MIKKNTCLIQKKAEKERKKRPVETKENSRMIDSKPSNIGTSLAVQWLRFCLQKKKNLNEKEKETKQQKQTFPSNAGGAVSIPGWGSHMPL